jgi:hypothetical protein
VRPVDENLRRWVRWEGFLFWGLLVLSLVPTLIFENFPSEDGGLHLANASVYLHSASPLFAEYYDLTAFPVPNLLGDLTLAGLLMFLDPSLAIRVMAIAAAVLLAVSVRWCLDLLRPGSRWLAVLVIPIGVGRFYHLFYLNFILAVALSFVAFGYWARYMRGRRASAWQWLTMALLVFVVYLSHALPFIALMLMITAGALDEALESRDRGTPAGNLVRSLAPVAATMVVPLALLAVFQRGQSGFSYLHGPLGRVLRFPVYPVAVLSGYEAPLAGLLAASILVIVVTTGWANRSRLRDRPGFGLAVLVLTVAFLLVPDYIGEGAEVPARLAVYAFILTMFWVTQRQIPVWAGRLGRTAAVVVVIGLTMLRLPTHAVLDEEMEEYLSGRDVIASGSTVLPLWMTDIDAGQGPGGDGRVARPLIELAGVLTNRGDVVDLHHLTGSLELTLFRWAPGYDIRDTATEETLPFVFGPGMVDIARYEEMGDGRVDYVYLWGRKVADPDMMASDRARDVLAQIQSGYALVFTSDGGMLEVYAARRDGP